MGKNNEVKNVFTDGIVLTKTMEVIVYKKIEDHPRYKKLLAEFHPTKNGDLKLSDFSHGSHTKLHWKCDIADDHEWEAIIKNRFRGDGCSCCSGHKIVLSNCLATTHPEIAKEWNY